MLQMIAEIQNLIEEYDQNKGWRRLFSWVPWLGYHADIRALRRVIDYSNMTVPPEFNWPMFFDILRNREADSSHLSARLLTSLLTELFGNVDNVNSTLAKSNYDVSIELLEKLGLNDFRNSNTYRDYLDIDIADVYDRLSDINYLTNDAAIILMHPHPYSMFGALQRLVDADINTPENITDMLEHASPYDLSEAFVVFSRIGKLNHYRQVLKELKYSYLSSISEAVDILREANLLEEENIEDVFSCQGHEADFASTLVTLSSCGCLNTENRTALIDSDSLPDVAGTMKMLTEANLLSADIARQVITYKNPNILHKAVYRLSLNAILSTETVTDVLAYELGDPGELAKLYSLLSDANILSDENRLAWLQVPEQLFLNLRDYIPAHELTQNINDQILRIFTQQAPDIRVQVDFMQFVFRIMREQLNEILNPVNYNNNLNYSQSKHKNCVEQSVAESAIRLNQLYGSKLDENKVLDELQSWIETLTNSDEITTKAKISFPRLRNRDYTNEASQISTARVLALIWCAIHDDKQRVGTLAGAKEKLLESLFDCQRSYNFDANDNHVAGGEDKNTCIAGEFITPVIKMDGVHPAIKIIYITEKDDAEKIKLPAIVKIQAVSYLQEQQKTANGTPEKQLAFNKLISDFRTDGVGAIWEKIKTAVLDIFFGEYGALYNNDQNDQHLKAIVDAQEYMPTKDTQGLLEKHNIAELDVKEENAALQVTSSGVVTTGLFANSGDKVAGDLNEVREKRAAYFMSKK